MEPEGSLPHSQQPPSTNPPVLSHTNPVHTSQSHILKKNFNIILLSMPRSYKWSFSFGSAHHNLTCNSPVPHTCHISGPSHYFYLITILTFGKKCRSQSSWFCSILHSLVTLSFLRPSIFRSTWSSLNAKDQVHPYKTYLLTPLPTYTFTHSLTCLLHGAESFLSS